MPIFTRHSLITVAVLSGVALAAAAGLVWSGVYNIGADEAHMPMTYSLLETVRERSITARSKRLHAPPNLADAARIAQGAGNYSAMCTGCHLAPGMDGTELSRGLYPAPPNLSQGDVKDPAHHFWVIKHGIKASGMPAWGKSMSDDYIWNMVAFLQQLPRLSPDQYKAMVASSGGHDHGGGETKPHDEAGGAQMPGMSMDESKPHGHPSDASAAPAADESKPHGHASDASAAPAADESKPHGHASDASSAPAAESKPHVDAPGAHGPKPAAPQGKPHVDAPGTPAHGH